MMGLPGIHHDGETVPMASILQINSSIFGDEGQSTRLATRLTERLAAAHPELTVRVRTLLPDSLPHLDAETFSAFLAEPQARSDRQRRLLARSDELIDELREARILVIGAPMYNFGIPSALKAWFDHVCRAGVTFRYTDQGPVGLLGGRSAYVVSTRGGCHRDKPSDCVTPHLRTLLGFLGIDPVHFVHAEGLALGEAQRQRALAEAEEQIDALAA